MKSQLRGYQRARGRSPQPAVHRTNGMVRGTSDTGAFTSCTTYARNLLDYLLKSAWAHRGSARP